jgi:hypothetical protein
VVAIGIPGVTNAVVLTLYDQLHYDEFMAVQELPVEELLTYPDGTGGALGSNGSSLTSQYNGSPVYSFAPKFASFGCYLSSKTAVAPGVSCTVEVTAFYLNGTEYPTRASCTYNGLGKVQVCSSFPSTWTQVGKLSFSVKASVFLTIVGKVLSFLLGSLLNPAPGTVRYIFDNFGSVYTCVAGKTNDPVTGLCV